MEGKNSRLRESLGERESSPKAKSKAELNRSGIVICVIFEFHQPIRSQIRRRSDAADRFVTDSYIMSLPIASLQQVEDLLLGITLRNGGLMAIELATVCMFDVC